MTAAAKTAKISIETKFIRKLFAIMRLPLLSPESGISHKIIGTIRRKINNIINNISQCKVNHFFLEF